MILVDTSVWINYFKGREEVKRLDTFIETNSIVVNDLILAEQRPLVLTFRYLLSSCNHGNYPKKISLSPKSYITKNKHSSIKNKGKCV